MKQVNQIAILNNISRKLLLKILHLQEVIRRTAVFNANKRWFKNGEKHHDKSFEDSDEVELESKPLVLGFVDLNSQKEKLTDYTYTGLLHKGSKA